MPEEKERPRPHGDPLKDEVANSRDNPEGDRAQVQSDDANGVPAFDEADGAKRKRQYKDGAELVSGLD